jgi:inosose dehydratase
LIRVANAPVSYGAFERTVGILPNVPAAETVLDAIAAAGYEGTELGPLGYLGAGTVLRRRLQERGLDLVGAFVEIRFGEEGFHELEQTLDAIDGFDAKAVLCDRGPRVQTPAEIERLLAGSDVPLLLDTGHLTAAGGDAVEGLKRWGGRINHVHLKDVRDGVFCELGAGEIDLRGFLAELEGYSGWLVVEQDWLPGPGESPAAQIEAQARNRRWLAESAGL